MKNDLIKLIDRLIAFSFYAIFFAVPLIIHPQTFELFEFNKMWFVFGMSIFIFFLWASKVIINGKLQIRRTPFDIPISLFLLSQILSTIFSLDQHVSFWGYYSRFNGGLLSTITYVFLYYAFASNLITHQASNGKPSASYKLLLVSLFSGLAVSLWGLPSHYGYDPTCLVFRGTFDVSCWTDQFHPTIRIFSTLGQPNWLATFLAILLPVAIGFGAVSLKNKKTQTTEQKNKSFLSEFVGQLFSWKTSFYLLLVLLFYVCVIFSRSQSAFIGLLAGLQVFLLLLFLFTSYHHKFSLRYLINDKTARFVFVVNIIFFAVTFFYGSPLAGFDRYTTLKGWQQMLVKEKPAAPQASKNAAKKADTPTPAVGELGGSDSGEIRMIVWRGALEVFKKYPVFGSGVETFAYAYYKVKPVSHNLTSEWDYLYNKAHNEYLNYLATTGAFGLGTYLLFIFWFFFFAIRNLIIRKTHDMSTLPISLGLIGSFIAILISNFFGFSVVIVNLFLFFIPLLFLEMEIPSSLERLATTKFGKKEEESQQRYSFENQSVGAPKVGLILAVGVIALYHEFILITSWIADQKYSLGYNYNRVGEYANAFQPLTEAVKLRPGEDLFKDELSINLATLAVLFAQQNQATQASSFADQAKQLSDEVVANHPNNVVYFKTRTRVMYTLSQLNPSYLDLALDSIQKAIILAPTDAKLMYNLGLFYNQKGDNQKAIQYLKQATILKPNYRDAYYALALLYSQIAKDNAQKAPSVARDAKQKAIETLEYTLKNIISTDAQSKELLKTLQGTK